MGRFKKKSSFSVHGASNFGIRADIMRGEMWLLNDKISSENVSPHESVIGGEKFQFGDLFIKYWHKQALYPCAQMKPDFSDFG